MPKVSLIELFFVRSPRILLRFLLCVFIWCYDAIKMWASGTSDSRGAVRTAGERLAARRARGAEGHGVQQ